MSDYIKKTYLLHPSQSKILIHTLFKSVPRGSTSPPPISSLNKVISRNRQEAHKGTADPQLNMGVHL